MNATSTRSKDGISRRSFLISASIAGGSLVVGSRLISPARAHETQTLNPFIRIPPVGKIEIIVPSAEMGQGVYMGLSSLIAEELELSLDQVQVVPAPADPTQYAHPILGDQITGGSVSIRGFWEPLRQVGASARLMLIAAAASRWGVQANSCRAELGEVIHDSSNRRLSYGSLAEEAARQTVPKEIPLKSASSFKVIGKNIRRSDSPDKVNGRAVFGLDARPPGVKFAAIALSPTFGGKLKSVDDADTLKVSGVRQIVQLSDAVAVIADHTGAARKGLAALRITWDAGRNAELSTEDLEARIAQAMVSEALIARNDGDVAAAESSVGQQIDVVYRMPILAHTAMEPMNCTVHVKPDSCEIWVGTQVAGRARNAAADVLGIPPEKVTLHNHLIGGGFGRRLDFDGVVMATRIAQHVEGPVQVVWSREEDIRHDCYRYLNLSKLTIKIGNDGNPTSWRHRVVGPAIMARFLPAFFKDGIDFDITGGAEGPYDIANKRVEFVRHEAPDGMLTGNWRGVGPTRNAPAVEGGIDEAAHLVKQDPLEYRRQLLKTNPRLRAVLDLAADRSGWSSPLSSGRGRGIAVLQDFGSFAALVAQVHVADGTMKIERLVCAVDCGIVINPDILKQQVEGGIIYGLSAALYGRITIRNGAVVEGNFDDSPVVRINECPAVEVHIINSDEAPGGVGELGTPLIAPALMNAIFSASGKRLRDLPLDLEKLGRS